MDSAPRHPASSRGGEQSFIATLKDFFNIFDERFEAYRTQSKAQVFIKDLLAALIVALVAIPLGVGFSIASGMRPEQGIIAGAVAGILGGLFGGSKFQVYGPTAAFITVISGIVHKFDVSFLILASMLAGLIVLLMGVFRMGSLFHKVPHSIVVGFTIGIAITIMISQLPDLMGALHIKATHSTFEKLLALPHYVEQINLYAIILGVASLIMIRQIYKITVFIPAPLIAITLGTLVVQFLWNQHNIPLVSTKYGSIGDNMFQLTLPSLGSFSVFDLVAPVLSIVFIAALESLLSARMADRLAKNETPYKPNKELFGQGVVNIVVPLFNGFPCTGALARTATSIKVGACSPVSSTLKGTSVIVLMVFFSQYLAHIPMACIAGLLIFVGMNMVKHEEVKLVVADGRFHVALMFYTAVMTILTDLFMAVGTGMILYYGLRGFFSQKSQIEASPRAESERELVKL